MVRFAPLWIVALITFGLGFSLGYLVGYSLDDGLQTGFRLKLAGFVTAIWALSVLAGIAIPEYETPLQVHLIMGGLVGYLFGIDHPLKND